MNLKDHGPRGASHLTALAGTLYHRLPFRLPWLASSLASCSRLLRQVRVDLWSAAGSELSNGAPLSVLCAAGQANRNFLLGLTLGASFRERYLGRPCLWRMAGALRRAGQGADLALVQVRKSQRWLLKGTGWFYIPTWVFGEVDIPCGPSTMKNESVKSDLRGIRKHALAFEVTRDPQRFQDFYHHMYVPYITAAHGRSAHIIPYADMSAEFHRCSLLLVTKQEKRIAGILIEDAAAAPRLWSLGIRDANPEHLREGAVAALFHFSFVYLEKKGFTKVNVGWSRAFLRDGVFRYKRKWSPTIIGAAADGFALKVLSHTPATRAFLENNPFIFERDGRFHGAVFVDSREPLSSQEVLQIYEDHWIAGLRTLFIYPLHGGRLATQDTVPQELSDRIVLGSAEDLGRSA